jgi:hypothetical protein
LLGRGGQGLQIDEGKALVIEKASLTITLIICPCLLIIFGAFDNEIKFFFMKFFSETRSTLIVSTVVVSILVYMILIYAPRQGLQSTAKYLAVTAEKKGYQRAILEYEFTKKTLYVAITILFILTILFTILSGMNYLQSKDVYLLRVGYKPFTVYDILYSIMFGILTLITTGLIKIGLRTFRTDFYLFLGKALSTIAVRKYDNEVLQIVYSISALKAYNKYLQRSIKYQINIPDRILLQIIGYTSKEKEVVIKEIQKSFNGSNLEPLRYLISKLSSFLNTEPLLIRLSLGTKLKEYNIFIVALASFISTMISFAVDLNQFLIYLNHLQHLHPVP